MHRAINIFFIACLSMTPALFLLWTEKLSASGHKTFAVIAAAIGGALTIRAAFSIYALLKDTFSTEEDEQD